MRVLMATPRFLPEIGGVERHVERLGQRLARAGCSVTVLTTGLEQGLPPQERIGEVDVRRVRARFRGRGLYAAPDIYAEIGRGGWDLVHVQSYHTLVAPLAMLGASKAKLPYVVTFHGGGHSSRIRNRIRPAQLLALRPLLARASRLVAVAQFEVQHYGSLLRIPETRFAVIPNGSELPAPAPAALPRGDQLQIASIGRLERYKGHHRVLAALPHILDRRPDATLWIAGTGPYEQDLRRLAARLGVADRVTIEAVPADAGDELAARLAAVDVVVLLSEFETHPLAVLESLALGRPVVVADTSGLRELAAQGHARSVPLESDPAAVASAVLAEVEQPTRAEAPVLPTWDDCAAAHQALYESVLQEAACAS
ncbi:MAG TPA: glycosyltransferase family 4 protein [Solirubrobacteraceae bacterium]|nr:glycosyltransferase family 4 protein [Solirubrobacteraceae bacterium]